MEILPISSYFVKLYIISKYIELYEESRTSDKPSYLTEIKFMPQIRIFLQNIDFFECAHFGIQRSKRSARPLSASGKNKFSLIHSSFVSFFTYIIFSLP